MRVVMLLSLAAIGTSALAQADAKPEMTIAEPAVRATLKDPDSAKFSWPYDFTYTSFRPSAFGKQRWVWVVCGTVNAKNSYGGYVGAAAVLVMAENGVVTKVMMDDPSGYAHVAPDCAKLGQPVG